jgi:uncharacterized protein YqeY
VRLGAFSPRKVMMTYSKEFVTTPFTQENLKQLVEDVIKEIDKNKPKNAKKLLQTLLKEAPKKAHGA